MKKILINTLIGSCAIAFFSIAKPVNAVEKITIQVGPIEQSISVTDLETYAKTGKLPESLQPYASFINPQIRSFLNQKLEIDPKMAEKFVANLLETSPGKNLLKQIQQVLPGVKVEDIQATTYVLTRQTNGINLLSVIRAFPGENLNVDGTALMNIALQMNTSYVQSQALTDILKTELEVPGKAFTSKIDPAIMGNQKVVIKPIILYDQQRKRAVPVDLYLPEKAENQLIVISHGLGASRQSFTYLAKHLSTHGFNVAVIEHTGSNAKWLAQQKQKNSTKLILPSEFVDRPKDITFLLDELAKMNQEEGDLKDKINVNQVSVIGHSFGGYTALALGGGEIDLDNLRKFCQSYNPLDKSGADWLQCLATELPGKIYNFTDTRVTQIIALNPAVGQGFTNDGLGKIKIPVLMLTGTDDNLTPAVTHQLQPFRQLGGKKYLLTAIGGTHLSVLDPDVLDADFIRTVPKELLGEKAVPIRKAIQGVILAFIKQETNDAKIYQSFLSPAYVQSLSTKDIPLRFNDDLPKAVTSWLNLIESSEKP